jgi:hypothetical protein
VCTDPVMKALNARGYSAVRAPRSTIRALDLIGKQDGQTAYLGSLDTFFVSSAPLPPLRRGNATTISGMSSAAVKAGLGVEILSRLLGTQAPSLGQSYQGAKTMTFSFDDPIAISYAPGAIELWMRAATPALETLNDYFEDGQVAIITEILTTKALTVSACDRNGAALDAQAEVAEHASAKASFTVRSTKRGQLTYSAKQPVTFAFIAHPLRRYVNPTRFTVVGAADSTLQWLGENSQKWLGEDGWADI